MKIYILLEHHRAEGDTILSVSGKKLSEQDTQELIVSRSVYSESERGRWCTYRWNEYDLEHYGN